MYYSYPFPQYQQQYMYGPGLAEALELIRRAVSGETADRKFYEYLISTAPDSREKEIIATIRDDEIKHFPIS